MVILNLGSRINMAAHWKEAARNCKLVEKKEERSFVWACGEAEAEDKQSSEGIMSDSSVPIEQWAHCIQMSKVLERAPRDLAP